MPLDPPIATRMSRAAAVWVQLSVCQTAVPLPASTTLAVEVSLPMVSVAVVPDAHALARGLTDPGVFSDQAGGGRR